MAGFIVAAGYVASRVGFACMLRAHSATVGQEGHNRIDGDDKVRIMILYIRYVTKECCWPFRRWWAPRSWTPARTGRAP